MKTKILVVGAGLTGLTAAYHLGKDCLLTEASTSVGGLAGTLDYKGYKLDHAIHIFYFKSEWVHNWLKETLGIKFIEQHRNCSVWIQNKIIPFPIQLNLNAISFTERFRILFSIFASRHATNNINETRFQNWAEYNFGKRLTANFFTPYNQKLFGVPIEELTTEWMGDYIPKSSLKTVLQGFFKQNERNFGRNSYFYYPEKGGAGKVAIEIKNNLKCEILFNESFESINVRDKIASFKSGLKVNYDFLISTISLDKLLQKFSFLPEDIKTEANLLRANPISILHILLNRKSIGGNLHWLYMPDSSTPFYRVTFVHNLSPFNCPNNSSALTLEFGGIVNDKTRAVKKSFNILIEMGLLNYDEMNSEFIWEDFDNGYVVYDKNINKARENLINFLKQYDIFSIGRYGNWEYSNMESAIIQGKETADWIINAK